MQSCQFKTYSKNENNALVHFCAYRTQCKYLNNKTRVLLPDIFNSTTALQTIELIWKRLVLF